MAMRQFKFFEGITKNVLIPTYNEAMMFNDMVNITRESNDIEQQLINHLTEEISREIDADIVRNLTRFANGGMRA
jgi:hypothetical protein